MADNSDSGNKTEPATRKRLRDARRRGEVPKSRDLTSTLSLAFSLALIALVIQFGTSSLAELTVEAMTVHQGSFAIRLNALGSEALQLLLSLSALLLVPIAAFGLLIEFLQAGPVFALEKLKPKLQNLHPASGLRRMFSVDNGVEVLKNIAKTALLFLLGYLVVLSVLDQLTALPGATPMSLVEAAMVIAVRLFGWTLCLFLLLSALDFGYQHHAFARKMKMSIRDIRQEQKDDQGDPMMKSQRKQMHREFAEQGANSAASRASVLVVNPTHIAVAIKYDRDTTPVPVIMAMGEGETAMSMRDTANRHHVPVLRNEQLARTLIAQAEEGDYVPRELFDVVAEVITWAMRIQSEVAAQRNEGIVSSADTRIRTPGEDLTDYPLGPPVGFGADSYDAVDT